ncbi:hypothetical protein ACJA88_013605 [Fusarium oxysporum]
MTTNQNCANSDLVIRFGTSSAPILLGDDLWAGYVTYLGDVEARRARMEPGIAALADPNFPLEGVTTRDYSTDTSDGQNPASLVFCGPQASMPRGDLLVAYVARTRVPFLAVDYRLAPEHPHPIPVNDIYAALHWLVTHSQELGVDGSRIGIMDDSAGGGLAVATALLARQDNGPRLAKLILLCPMLDDPTVSADEHLARFLCWNTSDNETGWPALLGCSRGREMVPEIATPARMADATCMPPLYIEVGELDLFRNESIELTTKFYKSGISAELRVFPGCPHGFDILPGRGSGVSRRAIENRDRAIKTIDRVDS